MHFIKLYDTDIYLIYIFPICRIQSMPRTIKFISSGATTSLHYFRGKGTKSTEKEWTKFGNILKKLSNLLAKKY